MHRRYNPENVTAYNIVPGLLGVILTGDHDHDDRSTMTADASARHLRKSAVHTPATPVEVMTGKIVHILIGLVQVTLILLAARWIFRRRCSAV